MTRRVSEKPKAVLTLLEAAAQKRADAARARRLAQAIVTDAPRDELLAYAEELDDAAQTLEEQAAHLTQKIARTCRLSEEIRNLVGEARTRLLAMRRKKPSGD